jgi:hypothetical protein
MDDWTIENASTLGEPGRNFPNREISSGAVTAEENIDIAHQAVNQLTGPQSNILSETELPDGKGIVYQLRDGTNITWRPVASDASNFMPKIDIVRPNGRVNLIFYPR